MTFSAWTVLPHEPIEKLSDRLWTVSGTMPKGDPQRRMSILKLLDGRLIVHNAIALGDEEMSAIDAWGEVAALVAPNAFHRQDLLPYKERYPEAAVYCPRGAVKRVSKLTHVAGDFSKMPVDRGLSVEHLDGMKEAEGVVSLDEEGGRTLIFNDTLLNVPPKGFFPSLFLHPMGVLSVPRFARLMWLKDRAALTAQIDRLSSNVRRIIVGHGDTVDDNAAEQLREALQRLG